MTQSQPRPESPENWDLTPQKSKKSRRQPRKQSPSNTSPPEQDASLTSLTNSLSISLKFDMPGPLRLLVASIGNPAPYLGTLHSAGHTVLTALGREMGYPPFVKNLKYAKGLVSAGPEFTFWQSPSLMNISGPPTAAAWRQFLADGGAGGKGMLVVVHDELELGVGEVKVMRGEQSHKGHNGVRSIKGVLGGEKWMRIGVGIGRPLSREKEDVADYVLRKMGPKERIAIEESVPRVLEELRRLAEG
ncbi:peptidyl-tRNA hydrolase [Bisporella sp. PMI_857]|nr:peptidyl-tRNA hydrolase [Bisporella sp. PMI_857]